MDFLKKYKKLIDLILLFVFIFIITILIKTYLRPFDHKLYRGIFPAWDNTPRRQYTPDVFWGSTPKLYETWLEDLVKETIENDELDEKMIFVNAWNEWAEGACLEPDRNYGYAYIQATRNVLEKNKIEN